MLRPRPAAAVLPLVAVLLAGCSSSPRNDLLDAVADVTDAANERDAADLRGAIANLRAEIDSQVRDNTLSSDESNRLLAIVAQLEADAALLDEPEESPSPEPTSASPTPEETESESPSPSPTRSRSPSPSPSPKPSPTPSPRPSQTQEPEPEPSELLPSPVTTSGEPSASPALAGRPTEASPGPSGA